MTPPFPPDPRESRTSTKIVRQENRRIFKWLAAVGVLLIVAELLVSMITGAKMNGLRVIVEAVLGFVGFYGIDPTDVGAAGDRVYKYGSGILTIIRTGKRSTDPIVTIEQPGAPADDAPAPPPAVPTKPEDLTGP